VKLPEVSKEDTEANAAKFELLEETPEKQIFTSYSLVIKATSEEKVFKPFWVPDAATYHFPCRSTVLTAWKSPLFTFENIVMEMEPGA